MADSMNFELLSVPFAVHYRPSVRLLPFEQVELLHVDCGSGSVQGDDNCKSDGNLRSGHSESKKDEYLTTEILKVVGECDEVNVGCVQHQLHRQQNRDDIAPDEDARNACQEDDGAQDEVVRNGNHGFTGSMVHGEWLMGKRWHGFHHDH